MNDVKRKVIDYKPKLIICGGSAYPRFIEFDRFREIANQINSYVMADIAHPSGLIASGIHPSPWPHCHVATLDSGTLRLVVSSSHWATRLRYQQKRLIRQLQAFNEFATLTKIHCRVQPPLVKKEPPVRIMPRSQVASASLRETADYVEDPGLKAALQRLARHHDDGQGQS